MRGMIKRALCLHASIVILLAIAPSWAGAATLQGVFQPVFSPTLGFVSPTLVLTDPSSGAAIGPAAAVSSISGGPPNGFNRGLYTFNIDAVPLSSWLVNGGTYPIDLAFQNFTGSWMGSPVTVSNLVVELSVSGGQVLGYLPTSDGFVHLPLAFAPPTSFTVVSGTLDGIPLQGGTFDGIPLQPVVLGAQGAQVIYRHANDTFDMNLNIGQLTTTLHTFFLQGPLVLSISNPGEFFCMDCGFDLPQGNAPPLIPEPSTAALLAAGLGVLSAVRRRGLRPAA